MRTLLAVLVCATLHAQPLLTCMRPSYHGKRMACGGRYDKRGQFVAVNRAGYCGDTIILYRSYLSVRGIIATRFNTCKDSLPYLKIDAPARFELALGMRGKGRIDSAQIIHNHTIITFK